MTETAIKGTTMTGTIGQPARFRVDATGTIRGAGVELGWYIAAEDRWHDPRTDSGVRQVRVAGTPVTETRVRVPGGDVVQRVYTVADGGGITVVEVANASTLPVAVAFDRADLLTERPIPGTPIEGIDLPSGSFVLPVGHRSTVRVGFAHAQPASGPLPKVASSDEVVKGWLATAHRAGRIDIPSPQVVETVTAVRCDIALGDEYVTADGEVPWLLSLDQSHRMGLVGEPDLDRFMVDVAEAVAMVGRTQGWLADAALDAAGRLLVAANETRAVSDLWDLVATRSRAPLPLMLPDDSTALGRVVHAERAMVRDADLLPAGIPASWRGQAFECHGLPSVAGSTVSYAVRWHGERPAVLWQQDGAGTDLTASVLDPGWTSAASAGEHLWPAPPDPSVS